MKYKAVIIEDEKLAAWSLSEHLQTLNFKPFITEFGKMGIDRALEDPPDVLFVDYRLPDISGIRVLESLQPIRNETIFFFMTAYGTDDVAVEALRLGAFEYLNKPLNLEEITEHIKRAKKSRTQANKFRVLKQREKAIYQLGSFVSKSQKMKNVIETSQKLIQVESGNILLLGETGVGKDTLARKIHEKSPRKNKPFTIINCASLSENLLESELFGHEKGAFTDAKTRKQGQVEIANEGTVYMDEIGEIPIGFQAKLLRFLEAKSFYRVGGTKELKVDVRIIASTNRDLRKEMEAGMFREDLYYRLNVISLVIPPLRDRIEDISLLVKRFIDLFNSEFHLHVEGISKEALKMLDAYNWPGNVRELKNSIERIFLLEKPTFIESWHFPMHLRDVYNPIINDQKLTPGATQLMDSFFDGKTFSTMEELMIRWAMRVEEGNQTKAAKRLEISRDQFRYKMKKYALL